MNPISQFLKAVNRYGITGLLSITPRLYYTRYKKLKTPINISNRNQNVQIHHRKTSEDLFGIWPVLPSGAV